MMDREAGLPHGYGEWKDNGTAGEYLKGWFHHGLPLSFSSHEYRTGFVFQAQVIGYVTCSADEWEDLRWFPKYRDDLRYGASSVECSISGKFFCDLPRAVPYVDRIGCTQMLEAMNRLSHVLPNNVTHGHKNDFGAEDRLEPDSVAVTMDTHHISFTDALVKKTLAKEAIIFFHGFNCNLKIALEVVNDEI
jgi:hypothetical protein